jgi:tetratricopeptide (TPR) repeat protein
MTQRQLAGTQLSVSYVSLLEAGKRSPTPETVQVLADALACDVTELIGSADSRQPVVLMLAQADLALEAGQVAAALERYEQVLAADVDGPDLLRRARLGYAKALHRSGRLADAVKAFERCARLGRADPANEASLEVYVGWCRCLYELGELVRAADIGKVALAEFDAARARESEMSIRLIATVAAVWLELGDVREAERLLDDGLQRASRVRSPTARGRILWNASLVATELGRYQHALELSEEALSTFRGSDLSRYVGKLLGVRGYLLLRADPPRIPEAIEALEEAVAHLAESADPIDKSFAYTELCYARLARGETDAAVSAAENARMLGSTAQLEFGRATTALAVALTAAGEREQAYALFAEAATVLDRLGAFRHAARAWIELAHALADTGEPHGAIDAYENAAKAMNIDDPRWRGRRSVPA